MVVATERDPELYEDGDYWTTNVAALDYTDWTLAPQCGALPSKEEHLIEIKTVGGRVLYTAETAQDVRTALEAAVSSGANLTNANLTNANLTNANLTNAYLTNAYLTNANLTNAYLTNAYLTNAYLEGANLEGANLRGAYLEGANLEGANLRGANLEGAYLEGALWAGVAGALDISLHAMNSGGKHWIKGRLSSVLEDGSYAYCSIGSVEKHSDGTVRALTLWLLGNVTGGDIVAFNDYAGTTWEDVKAVFSIAATHARRMAAQQ